MVPKMVPRLRMATVMKKWTLYKSLFVGKVVFIHEWNGFKVVHKVVPKGEKRVVLEQKREL